MRIAIVVAVLVCVAGCGRTTRTFHVKDGGSAIESVDLDSGGSAWVVRRRIVLSRPVYRSSMGLATDAKTRYGRYSASPGSRELWICTRVTGVDRPQCVEVEWNRDGQLPKGTPPLPTPPTPAP